MVGPLTDDPVNDFGGWSSRQCGGDGARIETNESSPAELAEEDVDVQTPLPVEQVHFRHLLLLLLPADAALPFPVARRLGGFGSDQTEEILHVSEVWEGQGESNGYLMTHCNALTEQDTDTTMQKSDVETI